MIFLRWGSSVIGLDDSPDILSQVLANEGTQRALCLACPSIPVRLRRVSKVYSSIFSDDRLAELLPKVFEDLGLFNSNPFDHCHSGDVESLWLMLIHGVDPGIIDHVCLQCEMHLPLV